MQAASFPLVGISTASCMNVISFIRCSIEASVGQEPLVNLPGLKKWMTKLWNPKGARKFLNYSNEKFPVRFTASEDLEKICRTPWIYNDDLVLIERGRPNSSPADYKLQIAEMWIRFFNLPLEFLTDSAVMKLASQIGTPFKPPADGPAYWSDFSIIKVAFEVNQPLKILIKAKLPKQDMKDSAWAASCVYAPNTAAKRKKMWDEIQFHLTDFSLPLLIIGDFNMVLDQAEKDRGSSVYLVLLIWDFMDLCILGPTESSQNPHKRKIGWSTCKW
ncbi:hypothetical protein Taro_056426 [Colocasia esculenta]|uniref:DUF4283 domain-containing protein n=1 Tax=Colocasia esculenta TaxID=4460 RepID=A0A843XW60_COLES|nr:hypothetical protein [Colocasia esculenta]